MARTDGKAYTTSLKRRIKALGADMVGVADAEPLKGLKLYPPTLLDPYPRVISIAIRIPAEIFRQITDRPTVTYANAYRAANTTLNQIALITSNMLARDGYSALPIPAAEREDKENAYPAISHKAVGNMVGLGWQGKSLLLVNPKYGPRIRLVSVLTDAPLVIDGPITNRCGTCTACRDACPAGAIKGKGTTSHYQTREEAFDWHRCDAQMVGFEKLIGIDLCGICIKVCPFGSD